MSNETQRFPWAILLTIVLLAATVRLYDLGRAPLWLDEQCQLAVAQTPTFGECWTMGGQLGPIGHLSFIESWIVWHLGGHTRAWFRIPAAMWGILSIPMLFILGRRWFSSTTALFAAAMLAVSGVHIQFSREARGYALLVFLATAWAWLLDCFAARPSWWGGVWLFFAAEIALQVHPAFLIVIAALTAGQLLVLWIGNKAADGTKPKVIAITIASVAIASAAIYGVIPRELPVSTANKPESNSLMDVLFDIYKSLLGGYWGVASYFIAALAAVGSIAGLREERTRRGTLCALSVSLAGALPIIVGHFQGAAVFARYALFALPFILLLPAIGIETSLSRWVKDSKYRCVAALVLAAGLLCGMYLQRRSPYDLEHFKQSRPEWPNFER